MLANRSANINIGNLSDSELDTSPLQLIYRQVKFSKTAIDCP